jgi:hypothetical protein
MNRPGYDSKSFFLGREVEHTPALGQKTLFVIGLQPADRIQAMLNDPYLALGSETTQHIYFGANHSYDPKTDQARQDWERLIETFLNAGYWCTLDFDIRHAELVAKSALVRYNTFIPIISAKIPHIRSLNYNTILKIDDRDFADTNPGVWCHRLHDLQNTDDFTNWSEYTKDEVLR